MPVSKAIKIEINGQVVDLGDINSIGLKLDYLLAEPGEFETKGSTSAISITVPATKQNDVIFGTFRNPEAADLTADNSYRTFMRTNMYVNDVLIVRGWALLEGGSNLRYVFSIFGGNADWLVSLQNLSLSDCLSGSTHTFDLATVQASWGNYDNSEAHDYVYAPVRYRQPFGNNDDSVSIFHLRPSLSIYWMIIRAFRQAGYTVKSDFLNTTYFRHMVLPWVWGSFFDIEGDFARALAFKAAGPARTIPTGTISTVSEVYSGTGAEADRTKWRKVGISSGYVVSFFDAGFTGYNNFRLNNTNPPNGFDNFSLYTFDDATGTMQWTYSPPSNIADVVGDNITANFLYQLIAQNFSDSGHSSRLRIEVTHIFFSGATTTVVDIDYDTLDLGAGGTKGSLLTQTSFSFPVSGISRGDILQFRLKYDIDGFGHLDIRSSGYLNQAPSGASIPSYIQLFSTFELTSLQLTLGGTVNFKFYDKFRQYKFFDLLRGLVDAFDLEIQTDPIGRAVTIEPFNPVTVSTYDIGGNITGSQSIDGYFKNAGKLEYTNKLDVGKEDYLQMFSEYERQIDFSFKADGSDGGANIFAARYKGVNLGVVRDYANGNPTGLISAVPGASRYLLPNRFAQGNRQKTNRLFAASLHYQHLAWTSISGVTPQLMAIFPENVSDSSASAISQTFEPRIAFYRGRMDPSLVGGWRFIGDPSAPYDEATATSFNLPYMFAVNYGFQGFIDPVLSYGDQLISGDVIPGLMRKYFLRRLAIMRNGQLYNPNIRLNLNDICNWTHREPVQIKHSFFGIIGIEGYKPHVDETTKCVMWKLVQPEQTDVDNCFPSQTSILTNPTVTPAGDLKYATLLLYPSDLPQV